MTQHSTDIAIIGAGVVGLAIAERLVAEGREVTLIDPADPGMGASYGNAGTIADYAVAPVGTPDVLWNLPSLLFDRNSPLAIRRAGLPRLAPWLLRFALQSLPVRRRGTPPPSRRSCRARGPSGRTSPPASAQAPSCSRKAASTSTAPRPRSPPPRRK